jgi:hypothetical protein
MLDMRPLHERYSDDGVRYPDALPDDPDFREVDGPPSDET